MRVALSASFGDSKEAEELLRTCDRIYTTQIQNIEDFGVLFPNTIISALPDCCPDMLEFLRERHKDDEVIEFSDLFQLRGRTY